MKRTPVKISQEVDIIDKIIDSRKILNLIDVCCGIGDIAAEIAKRRNIEAWGIEYSEDYVKNNNLKNIIKGDARIKQTEQAFSLVLNWFSSFSYFEKKDNFKILQNCYNYCNDVFILETANSINTINNFNKKISYNKEFQGEQYEIERISTINFFNNTLEQDWIINSKQNSTTHKTQTYLYFPKDIKDILLNIGFSKVDMFGLENNQLNDLTINSQRLIIKAQK